MCIRDRHNSSQMVSDGTFHGQHVIHKSGHAPYHKHSNSQHAQGYMQAQTLSQSYLQNQLPSSNNSSIVVSMSGQSHKRNIHQLTSSGGFHKHVASMNSN